MKKLSVHAMWDAEAGVWVANSKDVKGLVTEATSREILVEKLKVMIPELMALNHQELPAGPLEFRLKTEEESTEVILG